jgi:adenine-specific DNA-methyltransferase
VSIKYFLYVFSFGFVGPKYLTEHTWKEFRLPLEQEFIDKIYTQIEKNGSNKGERYREMGLYQAGLDERANQRYWIKCPDGSYVIPPGQSKPGKISDGGKTNPQKGDGVWRWIYERYKTELQSNNIVFKETDTSSLIDEKGEKSKWNIYTKIWLKDRLEEGRVPTDLIDKYENRLSSRELKELDIPFDFAKPQKFINYLIQIIDHQEGDIILDFFAGSGTTGHAVWNLNREDGGNRKFILVNLDEEVQDENIKKDYSTVADICIERLKRVSEKYRKEEQQKLTKNDQDFGFKVFRLDKSNFNLKDEFEISEEEDVEELKKKYLEWLGLWINEPLVGDWKPIDIVYETMLKEGFDLNSKIEERKIKGKKFFHVMDEKQELEFYMSLDEKITEEAIEEIRTPEYRDKVFVFLDKALSDNDKINLSAFVRLKVI